MTPEILVPVMVAILGGGGVLGALIGGVFARRKSAAESEHIRMESADVLITRLSVQLTEAVNRISSLERSERKLQDRVQHLEWLLRQNGVEIPEMPEKPFF